MTMLRKMIAELMDLYSKLLRLLLIVLLSPSGFMGGLHFLFSF